jgi:hypothetical protein
MLLYVVRTQHPHTSIYSRGACTIARPGRAVNENHQLCNRETGEVPIVRPDTRWTPGLDGYIPRKNPGRENWTGQNVMTKAGHLVDSFIITRGLASPKPQRLTTHCEGQAYRASWIVGWLVTLGSLGLGSPSALAWERGQCCRRMRSDGSGFVPLLVIRS